MRIGKAKTLACMLVAVVLASVPSVALAMLLVLSPDKVISNSDAIIVGTIASRAETESRLDVSIRVAQVLKGTVKARVIDLSVGPYVPNGSPPDAFPAEGTRVFVALRGDGDRWVLASDLNAVGIVQDGHVTALHHGSKIGINDDHWDPGDYVSAYDQSYRSHMGWFERACEWLKGLMN